MSAIGFRGWSDVHVDICFSANQLKMSATIKERGLNLQRRPAVCADTVVALAAFHHLSVKNRANRVRGPKRKIIPLKSAPGTTAFALAVNVDKSVNRHREPGCTSCGVAPRNGVSPLCRSCHNTALCKGPAIIEVPEDHENYKIGAPMYVLFADDGVDQITVESHFKQSWGSKIRHPEVRAIYEIISTEVNLKKYEKYLYDSSFAISDLALVY